MRPQRTPSTTPRPSRTSLRSDGAAQASLPFVAACERDAPVVHVLRLTSDALESLASFGSGAAGYATDDFGADRRARRPAAAWHHAEPRLLVTAPAGLQEWSPTGVTPDGVLVHVRLPDGGTTEHVVPRLHDPAALAVAADGRVLVAVGDAVLALDGLGRTAGDDAATAVAVAEEFLAATETLPDDADPWQDCLLTDGVREWTSEDLDDVTESDDSDPTWLQIQASVNRAGG